MINRIDQSGRKLALETRKGGDIENFQSDFVAPTPFLLHQYRECIGIHRPEDTRSSPTPCYNCHGLTFASRRTRIEETGEIHKILEEDKYIVIRPKDTLPGDIIIYYADDGDAEHSGIVLSEPTRLGIPMVVSKWGSSSEFVHWANQCPYSFRNAMFYRIDK